MIKIAIWTPDCGPEEPWRFDVPAADVEGILDLVAEGGPGLLKLDDGNEWCYLPVQHITAIRLAK